MRSSFKEKRSCLEQFRTLFVLQLGKNELKQFEV